MSTWLFVSVCIIYFLKLKVRERGYSYRNLGELKNKMCVWEGQTEMIITSLATLKIKTFFLPWDKKDGDRFLKKKKITNLKNIKFNNNDLTLCFRKLNIMHFILVEDKSILQFSSAKMLYLKINQVRNMDINREKANQRKKRRVRGGEQKEN